VNDEREGQIPTLEQYEHFLQENLGPDIVVRAKGDGYTTIEPVDAEHRSKCDFCDSNAPAEYVFTAHDVMMVADMMGDHLSSGGWGACVDCRRLIDAGDRKALAARAARVIGKRMGMHSTEALPLVRVAHAAFWKARKKR
jgi:hypothetical protein